MIRMIRAPNLKLMKRK